MLLKKGSKGISVKRLQTRLNIPLDGIFGDITTKQVKVFQSFNDLIDDGIVGNKTWAALFPIEKEKFNPNHLLYLLSSHLPDKVIKELPRVIKQFNINSILRLTHFISQCAHESNHFEATSENLNYSEKALNRVFRKYFKNGLASQYARNPKKIASRVYADRMGNGNESSEDGWRYKGRGYIQLTGRNNYIAFSNYIGINVELSPCKVSEDLALLSAGFFFENNKLWEICDLGSTDKIITKLTKKINGGTNGLDDRITLFKFYYRLLSKN